MRLLICAGGTGGGVYPALTVLQALGDNAQPILWVGSQDGMETGLVQRVNVPFTAIPAAGLHGVGLRALPRNLWRLIKGTIAANRILRQFKPDVILLTGGYIAAPIAIANRGTPILLYVPDIEPGQALKFLAFFARKIAVTAKESRPFFSSSAPVVVTGYPTRFDLKNWNKETARTKLGLSDGLPIVLVLGGSKGARSINRALIKILPELLNTCQVVHLSGQLDWPEIAVARAGLSPTQASRYQAYPYLHEEMGAALASADLAVSRAGASSLGEYPLFGLPAILIPYPFAWRYQKVNAGYLQRHGAAIMLRDEELDTRLLATITSLLKDHARLQSMRTAMSSLAVPDAAQRLAGLVLELASQTAQVLGGAA